MSEGNGNGGWRFERTFNAGHVGIAGSLLVAVFGAYFDLREKSNANDVAIKTLERRLDREAQQQDQLFGEIKGALRRIEDKLDRKVDKP
ncbi:MAG: hypothetical protein AB7O45_13245 [Alphaproteobacteria bacterium]